MSLFVFYSPDFSNLKFKKERKENKKIYWIESKKFEEKNSTKKSSKAQERKCLSYERK